jgi:uncharacterized protein (TIGR03437 family)
MRWFACLAVSSLFLASAQVRFLPCGMTATAIATASDGTAYLAGSVNGDVSIAELPADGSAMRVLLTIGGAGTEWIRALALGPDGSIFAAGTTTSPDFPGTTLGDRPSGSDGRAFVLRLDRDRKLAYSVLIGKCPTSADAIAVNARGEVLLSGQLVDLNGQTFFTTPGAVQPNTDVNTGFIVKLDATGSKTLVAIRGFGMGPVAYDANDNIYVAGADYGGSGIAPTPNAFQSTHDVRACAGAGFVGIGCFYQYVAKISADGTRLLYSTFVTGTWGATPAGLFVDRDGNAIVAGSTYSSDYPVTPGAYQTEYRVTNIRRTQPLGPHPLIIPPPVTAYLTKVNREGTGLVWSTFFSGTGSETITAFQIDSESRIVVTGLSGSRDLPGAQTPPEGCGPRLNYELPYLARLSPDGDRLLAGGYIYGLDPAASPALGLSDDDSPIIAAGQTISTPGTDQPNSIRCVIDPATNSRLAQVAPEQLITLFGDNFGSEPPAVSVDGFAAPILFSSTQQLNIQTPPEVAGRDVVEVSVQPVEGDALTRLLRVVPRAPAVFLDLARLDTDNHVLSCKGSSEMPADPPLARNEDGSFNTCENPAAPGSTVTLYLNGLGTEPPTASLQYSTATILALEPDPGSPAGVWRMRVQLADRYSTLGSLHLLIDGSPLAQPDLGIWIKAE